MSAASRGAIRFWPEAVVESVGGFSQIAASALCLADGVVDAVQSALEAPCPQLPKESTKVS